jgi:hypothetical protein
MGKPPIFLPLVHRHMDVATGPSSEETAASIENLLGEFGL